jgi:hypothetical protein
LLPRPGTDPEVDPRIACVEARADDLGLELVAPRKRVMQRIRALPPRQHNDSQMVCVALGDFFGLPAYVFAPLVVRKHQQVPSFLDEALRLLGR